MQVHRRLHLLQFVIELAGTAPYHQVLTHLLIASRLTTLTDSLLAATLDMWNLENLTIVTREGAL